MKHLSTDINGNAGKNKIKKIKVVIIGKF